jgi:phosphomannomutase/phosphomannomutase/phosphoglucomutase
VSKLTCFKAYDIRGRIPSELNDDLAYQIGQAYVAFVKPKTVAVGRDIRQSSDQLRKALIRGLNDSVRCRIGLCHQVVYFATFAGRLRPASWYSSQSAGLQQHEIRA